MNSDSFAVLSPGFRRSSRFNRRLLAWFVLIALPLLAIGLLIKSQLSKSVASHLREQNPTVEPTAVDPRQKWINTWLSDVKLSQPLLVSVGHTWLKIKIDVPLSIPVSVAVFEIRNHNRSAFPAVKSPFKVNKQVSLDSNRSQSFIEVLFDNLPTDSQIELRYSFRLADGRTTAAVSPVLSASLLRTEIPPPPILSITSMNLSDESLPAGVLSWELKTRLHVTYKIAICKLRASVDGDELCMNSSEWSEAQMENNKSTSFNLSKSLLLDDVIGLKVRVFAISAGGSSPPSNAVEVRRYAKTQPPYSLMVSDDGKKMTLRFTQNGILVREGPSTPDTPTPMTDKFDLVIIDSTNRTVINRKKFAADDPSVTLCSFSKTGNLQLLFMKQVSAVSCIECPSCKDDLYKVSATLVSLDESRAYELHVRSHSFAGWSDFSETLVILADFKTFPTLQKLRQWSDAISFELHSINETVSISKQPSGPFAPCPHFAKDKVYCSISGLVSDLPVQIVINLKSEEKFRTRTVTLKTIPKGECTEERNGLWFVGSPLLKNYINTALPEKVLELNTAMQVLLEQLPSWLRFGETKAFEDQLREWSEQAAPSIGLKNGFTRQCALCFLQGRECMFAHCISDCAGNPRALECRACHRQNCNQGFKTCTGINNEDMLPPPPPLSPPTL